MTVTVTETLEAARACRGAGHGRRGGLPVLARACRARGTVTDWLTAGARRSLSASLSLRNKAVCRLASQKRRGLVWEVRELCQQLYDPRRDLILSTQKGLLTHEVRVFLASLRAVGCSAEVVVFSAEEERGDLEELAETFNAHFISYDAEALSATNGPMNLHRFTLFQEFLQNADQPYDAVFLCDIRDVLFQQDPFETLGVDSGIAFALEPSHLPIGQCEIHSRWLSVECPAYNEEQVLASIRERERACAGTTIGTHEAVLKYCSMMREEAMRTVVEIDERQGQLFQGRSTTKNGDRWQLWCNDQGMHNAMLWTGRFEQEMRVTLYPAETSKLVTIGTLRVIRMNEDGEVLTDCGENDEDKDCAQGSVAAVVHQYDRVKALTVLAQNLYGLPGEEFQTFFERYALPGADATGQS